MSHRIKLENIHEGEYNRQTGAMTPIVTIEYTCSTCRRIVNASDKFCFFCGESLTDSTSIEHYHGNKRLDERQFATAKTLTGKPFKNFVGAIPDPLARKPITNP